MHNKGNNLTSGECDVVHLNAPYTLGTAGDTDMEVHTLGTYTHTNSLKVEGAWVCPWMSMSLISMTKLMKEGYTIVAEGAYCLAVSPSKLIYRFKIAASGLLALVPGVPKVLSATSGTPNPIRTASECT